MDNALRNFDKRQKSVRKKHRQMAQGYVTKLGRNGVIQHTPRRHLPSLSLPMLMTLTVGFLSFKSFLFVSLGDVGYQTRVDALSDGTIFEKAGAFMMQVEPATMWISSHFVPLLG